MIDTLRSIGFKRQTEGSRIMFSLSFELKEVVFLKTVSLYSSGLSYIGSGNLIVFFASAI